MFLGHPGMSLGVPYILLGHPRILFGVPNTLLGHPRILFGVPNTLLGVSKNILEHSNMSFRYLQKLATMSSTILLLQLNNQETMSKINLKINKMNINKINIDGLFNQNRTKSKRLWERKISKKRAIRNRMVYIVNNFKIKKKKEEYE
jgi:hypothetical protein